MSEKMTDEMVEKANKIADVLHGTKLHDVLKILALHYLSTFLQMAEDCDPIIVEEEMRDYFNTINESFHEIIRAQR